MNDCLHVNLVKQVGPMDGGAASTRYRCGVALWGLRDLVKKWSEKADAHGRNADASKRVYWNGQKQGQSIAYDACAKELEAALAKLEGCSAFFVVAPHEIGVSIGPPGEPSSGLTPTASAVLNLTETLCSMIIVGYENEQQGKFPRNGHIHKCQSCYEKAKELRDALASADKTPKVMR